MPEADKPLSVHTVLAFDFGLKRIGLAAGDTLTATASPLPAIAVLQSGPDWSSIERNLRAVHPRLLVVGAPYNADGTPGAHDIPGAQERMRRPVRAELVAQRRSRRYGGYP